MSKVFSVSNSAELMNALASAEGGDTIELAGGHYGDVTLRGSVANVEFDSTVSIVSADSQDKAVISGLDLRDASNIKFDNLIFDYEFSEEDPGWLRPFTVKDSNNITFSNSSFLGDVARGVSEVHDGYGTAFGLSVMESDDIVIKGNNFETWGKGLSLFGITNLQVIGNEISDLREDAMNIVRVVNVDIRKNYIHDNRAHPEDPGHSDMIQLWVLPTHDMPSSNINISGNILDIGEGVWTQAIFMRNGAAEENPEDTSMYWQNVKIENNTIYNNHTHGITVGETVNLTVQNNSVIQVDDALGENGANMPPQIHIAENSENVLISKNIAAGITGYSNQDSWDVTSNTLISKEEYIDYFIASSMDSKAGTHNFYLLPDTEADQLGAGSEHTQFLDAPDSLTPFFQVHSDASSSHSLIFDASLTVGPLGLVSENEAEFLWTFEDGSTATGMVVKHAFGEPGYYDVTLTVVAKDGTTAQAGFTAGISGDRLVQFDVQTGHFETTAYGEETPLEKPEANLGETADGFVLELGGDGIKASIPNSELTRLWGTEAFEMSMSLKADSAASWGEVANVHMSFHTAVDQSGNFVVTLFLDDGSRVNVTSQGVDMRDGDVHDITIRFDGAAEFADIIIDDNVVASEKVSGSLGGEGRSLMFGNPWGSQKFDGELSAFSLSAESFDFPIYDDEAVPEPGTETSSPEEDTVTTEPDNTETETVPEEAPVEDSGETATPDETEPEEDPVEDSGETVTPAPTEPEEDPAPAPEEDTGLLQPLLLDGYELDIASLPTSDTERLRDDAHVTETQGGPAIVLDGDKDYVYLARLEEFEDSQKIAFSVDFVNKSTNGSRDVLVWNHMKHGLSLEGDGLIVHVQNSDSHLSQGFHIESLGLNDGKRHNATVMVDAEKDLLQVVVDGVLVLDERDTDFDFVGAGGREWGWNLSTPWNQFFEGKIHGFQVSDKFDFPVYDGEAVPESGTETGSPEEEPVTTAPDSSETETAPEEGPVEDSGERAAPVPTEPEEEPAEDSGERAAPAPTEPEEEPAEDSGERAAPAPTEPAEEPAEDSGERAAPAPTEPEEEPAEDSGETAAPAPTTPAEEPAPALEEDTGLPHPLLLDGYELDIAGLLTSDTERLRDDVYVTTATHRSDPAIVLDGHKDYVSLGRLEEFEDSHEMAFSVDFVNNSNNGSRDVLVWNHMKFGLSLEGDGIIVHAQNSDSHFSKGFYIEGLGLNDGERHNATVMVDAEEDRLQVVVDDVVVLDERDTDFDFVGAGGNEWGWNLGASWGQYFEGEIHDFQVSDKFEFLDATSDDGMLIA